MPDNRTIKDATIQDWLKWLDDVLVHRPIPPYGPPHDAEGQERYVLEAFKEALLTLEESRLS